MAYDYPNFTALRMNATRKIAVKKAKEYLLERYEQATRSADGKKISNLKYRALLSLAKSELGKKLIDLTRIEKLKPY